MLCVKLVDSSVTCHLSLTATANITPVFWPYGKLEPIWTIGTTYGLDQGSYSEEEGGGRRKEEKDGPLIRLAL